MASNTRQN